MQYTETQLEHPSARQSGRVFVLALGVLIGCLLVPWEASAQFEISLGFSSNRRNYSDSDFYWSKTFGGSIGYRLFNLTEIEYGVQYTRERTFIQGYEDTTFDDLVQSINLVQSLLTKRFAVQPYVKGGAGQLHRTSSGTYAGGPVPYPKQGMLTGVLGAGFRVYITRNIALRAEATSYLEELNIQTWKDNLSFTSGVSLRF